MVLQKSFVVDLLMFSALYSILVVQLTIINISNCVTDISCQYPSQLINLNYIINNDKISVQFYKSCWALMESIKKMWFKTNNI